MQPFMMMSPEEAHDAQVRAQMEHDSAAHRITSFIHSLNEEQLESFRMLLRALDRETGPELAAYYRGFASQIAHFKFGTCECGHTHTQPEDFLRDAESNTAKAAKPSEAKAEDTTVTAFVESRAEAIEAERAEHLRLLDEYNLLEGLGKNVVCRGCLTAYPSLEDRMLKGPDDCHHCHLKSKNG